MVQRPNALSLKSGNIKIQIFNQNSKLYNFVTSSAHEKFQIASLWTPLTIFDGEVKLRSWKTVINLAQPMKKSFFSLTFHLHLWFSNFSSPLNQDVVQFVTKCFSLFAQGKDCNPGN